MTSEDVNGAGDRDVLCGGALEIRHLRLVSAIAREGSVTKAAASLHFSQSAASHQLNELEKNLDVRLFDRVGKRMVLTAAGTKMLETSEKVLAVLSAARRDLAGFRKNARVPLRVTTSCYTSYRWLPAALAELAVSHPQVDITIVLEATRRAADALIADEVDFAITSDPPKDEPFVSEALAPSEVVVVTRPDHPVVRRAEPRSSKGDQRVRWRDLRGSTILLHDTANTNIPRIENAVRNDWERESGERLAQPVRFQNIPLTEAILELAASGTGVAIADAWLMRPHLGSASSFGGSLVALPMTPPVTRVFHAVWRRANPRGLPLAELAGIVRAEAERTVLGTPRTPKKQARRARSRG